MNLRCVGLQPLHTLDLCALCVLRLYRSLLGGLSVVVGQRPQNHSALGVYWPLIPCVGFVS
jgi:hypothetical protein